jgi:hypothetical protein
MFDLHLGALTLSNQSRLMCLESCVLLLSLITFMVQLESYGNVRQPSSIPGTVFLCH